MKKLFIILTIFLMSGTWSAYGQVGNDFLRIESRPGQPLSYDQLVNWSKALKWQPYFVVTGSRIDSLMVVGAIWRDTLTTSNGIKRYYLKYMDYWVDTTRRSLGFADSIYNKVWILNKEPDSSKFNFAFAKIPGNLLKYKAEYTPIFDSVYVDTLGGDSINVFRLSETTIDTVAMSSMYEDIFGNIGINTKFIPFAAPAPDSLIYDSTNNKQFYGITAFDSTGRGFFFEFVSTGDTIGGLAFSSFKNGSVNSNIAKIVFSGDTCLNLITPKLKVMKDSLAVLKIDSNANFNIPVTVADSMFRVDTSGNIKKIRGKDYLFPISYADSVGVDSVLSVLVLTDSTGTLKFDTSIVKKLKKIPDTLRFTRILKDSVNVKLFSKTDTLSGGFKDYSLDSISFTASGDTVRLFAYVKDTSYTSYFVGNFSASGLSDTNFVADVDVGDNSLLFSRQQAIYENGLLKSFAFSDSLIVEFASGDSLNDPLLYTLPLFTYRDENGLNAAIRYRGGIILDPEGLDAIIIDTSFIALKSDLVGTYVDDTTWKSSKLGQHALTDKTAHDFSDAGTLENLLIVKSDTSYYLSALYDSEYKLLASDGTGMFSFITLPNLTDSLNFVDDTTWKASKLNVSDTTNFYNLPDSYVTGISSSKSADSITITLSRNNGLADLTTKFKDSVGTGSGLPVGGKNAVQYRDTASVAFAGDSSRFAFFPNLNGRAFLKISGDAAGISSIGHDFVAYDSDPTVGLYVPASNSLGGGYGIGMTAIFAHARVGGGNYRVKYGSLSGSPSASFGYKTLDYTDQAIRQDENGYTWITSKSGEIINFFAGGSGSGTPTMTMSSTLTDSKVKFNFNGGISCQNYYNGATDSIVVVTGVDTSAGHVTAIHKTALKFYYGIFIGKTVLSSIYQENSFDNLVKEDYKSDPDYQEFLEFKRWQATRKQEIKSNLAGKTW